MKVYVEGSLEQKLFQAREKLLEYSKDKNEAFTVLSTFESHMYVVTESGTIQKLVWTKDGALVESAGDLQSAINSMQQVVAEAVKIIQAQIPVAERRDLSLQDALGLLEAAKETAEKKLTRQDRTFLKRILDFIADVEVYVKRMLKESQSGCVLDKLVLEDISAVVVSLHHECTK